MIVGVPCLLVAAAWAEEPSVDPGGPTSPPTAAAPAAVEAPAEAPAPVQAPAPEAPQEPPPQADVLSAEDVAAANEAYLDALGKWQSGFTMSARMAVRHALEIAPDLEPARLLEGYVLLRLGERAQGLAKLHDLMLTAKAEDVRRAAARTWHRYADKLDRTAPSILGGLQVAGRYTGEKLAVGAGYSIGYDQPLWGEAGFALELSGYDTSAGIAVIEGPVLDVLGSVHLPFAGSAWGAKIQAGPAIWFADGAVYGDTIAPTVGSRAVIGLDARPWPSTGFFFGVGGWCWPGLAVELPAWQFAWDFRTALVFWFGRPQG